MRKKDQTPNPWACAEIEIRYRPALHLSNRPYINSSRDGVAVIRQAWNADTLEYREEVKAVMLNRRHRVLGIVDISAGGISGTVADPRVILGPAIKAGASGIILAHNHPSGNPKPSAEDLNLTKKIKAGAAFFDINVLDHVIITADGFTSMADEGMI